MKVVDDKITEATESELYGYYLSRGWEDVYDFPTYKRLCKENGTVITDDESEAKE